MQSEKYFNLLCSVISSLWCIYAAEVTALQTGSPARGSAPSSGPYEDEYQEAPELQVQGSGGVCFPLGNLESLLPNEILKGT